MRNKLIAAAATAILLCTSCTVVNTGGFSDSIGHERPEVVQPPGQTIPWQMENSRFETWRKGNFYYVKLPVVYAREHEFLLLDFNIMPWMSHREWEYPEYDRQKHLEWLRNQQPEIFYAELTAAQVYDCGVAYKFAPEERPLYQPFRLLRADEVDLTGAFREKDTYIFHPDSLVRRHLSDRRSLSNQVRRPLTWVLQVADIPLSLGASTIGLFGELLWLPISVLSD